MKKNNLGSSFDRWRREERTEQIKLSERDTVHVLALLEHPPPPNAKLSTAAEAWAANHKKQTVEPSYGN